jgi:Fungal Zn(2)-Cys(6) binuclear cluster domain
MRLVRLQLLSTERGIITMNGNFTECTICFNFCDRCSANKRRCDREDGKACKQCIRRDKPCVFSSRRNGDSTTLVFEPQAADKPKQQQQEQQHRSIALFNDSSEYSRELHSQSHGCKSSRTSSSSSSTDCVQLKRARFSCSPATGLVGTMENSFLATFLTDFSTFMPIVNEQPLRQSLMQLLQPAAGAWRSTAVPDKLAASTFWCAIAMGALLQGVPEETVRHYTRLSSSSSTAERSRGSSSSDSSSSSSSDSSSSAVSSVQQVQSALLRACLSSFLGDTLAFVSCTVTAVQIWDSSGGNAEGSQHSSRNGIEFAVRYLNHQVQFRHENPIEWSEIDGPYTRSGGGVKTAGLPVAFTDPLRRRDAKQFVLALGECQTLWCSTYLH